MRKVLIMVLSFAMIFGALVGCTPQNSSPQGSLVETPETDASPPVSSPDTPETDTVSSPDTPETDAGTVSSPDTPETDSIPSPPPESPEASSKPSPSPESPEASSKPSPSPESPEASANTTEDDPTGNDKQGGMQTGVWSEDGTVFINEWAGFKFTLPDGYHALTSKEMQSIIAAGIDIVFNGDDSSVDMTLAKQAYDLCVVAPASLPNMIIVYENLNVVASIIVDSSAYWEVTKQGLLDLDPSSGIAYSVISEGATYLMGDEWFGAEVSVNDGAGYQSYYIRKLDSAIISIITTYSDATRSEADSLINALEKY